MTNWKSATCERCTFRVDVVCRRFPPSNNKDYPYVAGKEDGRPIIYEQACAEYTEEGQLPLQQIGDIPTAPLMTEEEWEKWAKQTQLGDSLR